jgi:hypothetical protein
VISQRGGISGGASCFDEALGVEIHWGMESGTAGAGSRKGNVPAGAKTLADSARSWYKRLIRAPDIW